MTAAELLQIRNMVREEIAKSEQRVQEEVERLRNNDTRHDTDLRKHSGTHKDLAENVRHSLSQVKEATNNDLLRATAAMGSEIGGAIGELRAEMNDKIAEAAKGAEAAAIAGAHAAVAAKHATTDLVVAQIQKKDADKRRARWQAIAGFIGLAIYTAITHFLK